MTSRTRVNRWFLTAAIGLTSAVGLGNLAAWLPELARAIRAGTVDGVVGGTDFAMFRAAAVLASEGRWAEVYSIQGLAESMNAATGGVSFAYPPPFALFLQPLTQVPYPVALSLWMAVGILGVLTFVVTQRPMGLLGLGAMLFPTYMSLRFAQFAPLAIVFLTAAGLSLRRERSFLAGLFLGLLVLKPQFLVGLLIVGFATHRRHKRMLSGAVASSVAVVVGSMLWDFGAWRAFVAGFADVATPGVATRWDFSILGFTSGLPGSLAVITAVILGGAAIGVCIRLVRYSTDAEEMVAIGLVLSLLISPRVVAYDWILLLVVFAWIGRNVSVDSPLVFLGGLLALASLSGYLSLSWLAWPTLAGSAIAASTLDGSHLRPHGGRRNIQLLQDGGKSSGRKSQRST